MHLGIFRPRPLIFCAFLIQLFLVLSRALLASAFEYGVRGVVTDVVLHDDDLFEEREDEMLLLGDNHSTDANLPTELESKDWSAFRRKELVDQLVETMLEEEDIGASAKSEQMGDKQHRAARSLFRHKIVTRAKIFSERQGQGDGATVKIGLLPNNFDVRGPSSEGSAFYPRKRPDKYRNHVTTDIFKTY
jgi:hypothetical protein